MKEYKTQLAKRESAQRYYQANKEKIAEKWKKYYQEHRDEIIARQKEKYQKPSNKVMARTWHRERDRRYRQKTIEMYGGKCVRCGYNDWRALQVDHINGGGNAERKLHNSWSYRKELLGGNTDKYQLLCANCNKIKQYENKEFSDGRRGQ